MTHELQHVRPPCPSPTPGVHTKSRPLSGRCHPAISFSVVPFYSCSKSLLPSIRVFSNESTLRMRWPRHWSFSLSIIPSKEHPRLISFRMDWLDLLAVQGTLKSLLQHHSSKASGHSITYTSRFSKNAEVSATVFVVQLVYERKALKGSLLPLQDVF